MHSTLSDGYLYSTLGTKVNLVRAVRPTTGPLLAEGSVVHRGRTVATAESRLVAAVGTLYVHATSTCQNLHNSDHRQSSSAAVGSAGADAAKI